MKYNNNKFIMAALSLHSDAFKATIGVCNSLSYLNPEELLN